MCYNLRTTCIYKLTRGDIGGPACIWLVCDKSSYVSVFRVMNASRIRRDAVCCMHMWVPLQLPLQYFHASHRACMRVKGFAYFFFLLCCCKPIVNLKSCLLQLLGKNVCFVPHWSTTVVGQSHQPKFENRCVGQTAIACFSKADM